MIFHRLFFFFFNDTATTEIYTFPYTTLFRSLPRQRRPEDRLVDAASCRGQRAHRRRGPPDDRLPRRARARGVRDLGPDRKSTRLNSSHANISYAVFCLKKKKKSNLTINSTID